VKVQSNNEQETKEIGRKLGKKLQSGDVVCLIGELGSGKTTLVKGIASVFGINERDIASASFIIIAEHRETVPFYHIDLYRLGNREVSEIGLDEYLGRDGISVIEWAEKAKREIPEGSIEIRIRHINDNSREIDIHGIKFNEEMSE
jgi:tRNA threonylcarbamoyladenosine biosynthesis protein TsaE